MNAYKNERIQKSVDRKAWGGKLIVNRMGLPLKCAGGDVVTTQ